MQVNIENAFNNVFRSTIFRELRDAKGPLASIVLFTMLFYGVHYSIHYQHGQHEEGVTIIESSSSMRQREPLGGPLFALAHYQALLKTITQAPNYVFPFLASDTHIVGPMNEVVFAFDHLLT